jgi:hypothetical protein
MCLGFFSVMAQISSRSVHAPGGIDIRISICSYAPGGGEKEECSLFPFPKLPLTRAHGPHRGERLGVVEPATA